MNLLRLQHTHKQIANTAEKTMRHDTLSYFLGVLAQCPFRFPRQKRRNPINCPTSMVKNCSHNKSGLNNALSVNREFLKNRPIKLQKSMADSKPGMRKNKNMSKYEGKVS